MAKNEKNNEKNNEKTVSEWLKWSANEMKKAAELSCDPILKTKFEQIAGINRQYCDKLGFSSEYKDNRGKSEEIEILKAAYFCQQSVFWRFSLWPLEQNDTLFDEIVDSQKTIVRELYSEIKKRSENC